MHVIVYIILLKHNNSIYTEWPGNIMRHMTQVLSQANVLNLSVFYLLKYWTSPILLINFILLMMSKYLIVFLTNHQLPLLFCCSKDIKVNSHKYCDIRRCCLVPVFVKKRKILKENCPAITQSSVIGCKIKKKKYFVHNIFFHLLYILSKTEL